MLISVSRLIETCQSQLLVLQSKLDGGYGKLKGETFRLSNMGDETEETVAHLLACLDDCLS